MISYKKIFQGFIWLLFFSFLVLYFSQANGYYEDLNNKKTTLTEEKIKQFEEDVRNGKEIRVENYVVNMKKDYGNVVSNFGLFTSQTISKYFKKGLTSVFGGIDKMVNEK
ncbi:MAG: hypothetical protein U0M66_04180 [Bacilli bacterium]|nr:hypothetical protein [Bacilli bacterium]